MARQEALRKLAEWQQQLRRYDESGLTASWFCVRERVTVSMVWYRRRKCAGVTRVPPAPLAVFTPVEVVVGRSVSLRVPINLFDILVSRHQDAGSCSSTASRAAS